MLAVTLADAYSSLIGRPMLSAIRAATTLAFDALSSAGSSTTNSSPPSRETLSVGRTTSLSLPATRCSTVSPAAWP